MASFNIQNPPSNLTLLDFKSRVDSLGAAAKSCRFLVRISPNNTTDNLMYRLGYNALFRELSYLCEATELPGRGFDVSEARYHGPVVMFPVNTKYSNEISMSFISRGESYERQLFDDWMSLINPTNNFNFNYPKQYYANIDVYKLTDIANAEGNAPQATYLWSLKNAWPAQILPQPVTWADQDVLRISVTFIYQYWERPGRDATPGGAPGSLPGLEDRSPSRR